MLPLNDVEEYLIRKSVQSSDYYLRLDNFNYLIEAVFVILSGCRTFNSLQVPGKSWTA